MKKNINNPLKIMMGFGRRKVKELLGSNLIQKSKMLNIVNLKFTLSGIMMERLMPQLTVLIDI